MKLITTKTFRKSLKKCSKKVLNKAFERLEILRTDPFNKQLRRHKLKGESKYLESIDVTGDVRIIFHPKTMEILEILDIGTHSQLY